MERRLRAAIGRISAVALMGTAGVTAVVLTRQADAAESLNDSDVTANLWEWNWPSIARACTDQLGPAGYGAVQVAPPQESVTLPAGSGGAHPWWEVYQPVSYQIHGRLGTREQFSAMVRSCHTAGVRVYVDAVINHTAGSNNSVSTGYAGSSFDPKGYSYPAVPYSSADFHHKGAECTDEDGRIDAWNDPGEVFNCELSGLSDLKTEKAGVRDKLTGYLNDLIGIGVDGFRVDAAKHLPPADFAPIVAGLHRTTAEAKAPYIAQEVAPGGTGDLALSRYIGNGDVLGFSYAYSLKEHFGNGTLSDLQYLPQWDLGLAGAGTAAMVANHDTERDRSTLSYRDGATYRLASWFMLAFPYGKPFLYDGFVFPAGNTDQSPPADSTGAVTATDCGNGAWQCLTQATATKGMVAWHNATRSVTTVSDFTAPAATVIGFHRGSLGWFGLNASGTASTATYATGLADGTYCDRITGGATAGGCTGTPVTVSGGKATVTIPANSAVAIDGNARSTGTACATVAVTFTATVTTTYGQNVFVLGNQSALSTWATSGGTALSPAAYPVWTGTVSLPANTTVEYKYVKKEGSAVTWESGDNRTFSTGSACTKTLTDTWG
ncbi:carbohydrate-binding module family 20 domain-containing protein [Actinoplanes sp. N902-109]|uniref:carbohydrate-binding module family 20 domain-containing protein n=1 Tax=Actinoplanes sp. (strain N902-109) TaxID=649831 RepID=UPI0007C4CFED|nr:carbohydrate-binding module family 20 domain-containing protein [Actinoplanes sp. N902-109]